MIELFPFTAIAHQGNSLFLKYVAQNREAICEKLGYPPFTRNADSKKIWSYYEVDMEVLSATEVEFTTYGMESPVFGGRGERQEIIKVIYTNGELNQDIEDQKWKLAREQFKQREAKRRKVRVDAEIQAVYEEMFPTEHPAKSS